MEIVSKQSKHKGIQWQSLIPEEEFIEVDINKVRLVEEIHLSSRVSIFNIRRYREAPPIAVRENENGEYELVAGIRGFIIGKLFSRNVRAYITTLSREEFKKKYYLDK